jgi:L-histidine Nalpha-methyltransferase / hercynylcysteine S-oxide synthase
MIIQRADSDCSGTLPPPGIHIPVWGELVKQWNTIPLPVHTSVELGPEVILVGRDDCELDDYTADEVLDVKSHDFGWDNENPCRQVEVAKFKVDFRPITVKEFYEFWVGGTDERVSGNLPASWVEEAGKIKVCLVP